MHLRAGLDGHAAADRLDQFRAEGPGPRDAGLDEEVWRRSEAAFDRPDPVGATCEDGLDGAEILVVQPDAQRHPALHADTSGYLQRLGGRPAVGLDEAAGAQPGPAEPAGHHHQAVAGPATEERLQDWSPGRAGGLPVIVAGVAAAAGRTPERRPAVMGGIVVLLADSLQPLLRTFEGIDAQDLPDESGTLDPGFHLGPIGEAEESIRGPVGGRRSSHAIRSGWGQRVRILQVNKFYDPRGGTERVLYDLEDGLRARGHEVGIFAGEHPDNRTSVGPAWFVPERDYGGTGAGPGWRGRLSNAIGTLYDRDARRRFAAALDEFRPDLVHLHNIYHQFSPSILDELYDRKLPAVLTVHDYKLVCPVYRLFRDGEICEECVGASWPLGVIRHRCSRGSLPESLLLAVEASWHRRRDSYPRALDVFIAPSRFMADKLEEGGISADRIVLSRNAPRTVPARAEAAARAAVPTLLFAGRLSPEKGADLLVAAARQCPQVELRIAGTGPEAGALQKAARGLDHVHFLGHLDARALGQERARSWATLVPSRWYENAPLSVIESWWAGRPVLGSGHGGLAEMLGDGDAGWMVAPQVDAWVAAFTRAADADAELSALGARARLRAEREHSFEDCLDRTLQIYADALAGAVL